MLFPSAEGRERSPRRDRERDRDRERERYEQERRSREGYREGYREKPRERERGERERERDGREGRDRSVDVTFWFGFVNNCVFSDRYVGMMTQVFVYLYLGSCYMQCSQLIGG